MRVVSGMGVPPPKVALAVYPVLQGRFGCSETEGMLENIVSHSVAFKGALETLT